jgi:hypothetical protein
MKRRLFRCLRVLSVVAALSALAIDPMHTVVVLHADGDHSEDGGCDEGGGQRCRLCGCHKDHGSSCKIDHASVCSGGGCSRHDGDCVYDPLEMN